MQEKTVSIWSQNRVREQRFICKRMIPITNVVPNSGSITWNFSTFNLLIVCNVHILFNSLVSLSKMCDGFRCYVRISLRIDQQNSSVILFIVHSIWSIRYSKWIFTLFQVHSSIRNEARDTNTFEQISLKKKNNKNLKKRRAFIEWNGIEWMNCYMKCVNSIQKDLMSIIWPWKGHHE